MFRAEESSNRARLSLPALAGLGLISLAWLVVCVRLQTGDWSALRDPIGWLDSLGASAAADALANSAEVMAGVLAIAITVVAIVVELAANRYSHRVTTLFLRDPVNLGVLSLFALTTVQCVWASLVVAGTGSHAPPGAGFMLVYAMLSLSLLLLLPYFAYVLAFISPLNIISRIALEVESAMDAALRSKPEDRAGRLEGLRAKAALGMEELHDVARSAIVQSDRSVAMGSVNALSQLFDRYQSLRRDLPRSWLELDPGIRNDPDFVALESEMLDSIDAHGLWFELKVLRRLIALLEQCVPHMRDVAGLVAIRTRELGVRHAEGSEELLDLSVNAFNSYLRAGINGRDLRSGLYLLNQYRILAEAMIETRPTLVARMGSHLRYYGQLAYRLQQPFLLEVVAHDLAHLIEVSRERNAALTDQLLDVLLEVDMEIGPGGEQALSEVSLIGVRKAQIQIGTLLLSCEDAARAARVAADLAHEPAARLRRIVEELRSEERSSYWEIVERGSNFGCLALERRAWLDALLDLSEQQRSAS